jgi:hypothetical protein
MAEQSHGSLSTLECCPPLERCDTCDVLDFRYRLPFRPLVQAGDRRQVVPVEVTLHFRLTRCAGPLGLGDLLYTTTLLPGEQVRLFTSDRRSRFTFDTQSKLAYRNEATSEESSYAAGMANAMSDLSVVENENRSSSFHESSVSGGGGLGIDLGIISLGGSVSGSSHDAESTSTFARQLSQHAQSSSRHVEVATRAASSTSVGEVQSRTHTETESEDHFESASRVFSNPNRCHALTFLFYRIDKCQSLRWELVGIDRRVDDPAAPTGVDLNPPPPITGVPVIPSGIVATSKDRLEVERMARASAIERQGGGARFAQTSLLAGAQMRAALFVQQPIPPDLRKAALAEVDKELAAEGLLEKAGDVSPKAKEGFGWERTISLPTPGVLVKGCLDDCDICEPNLMKEIELDLVRKELENELLKKQIDLLEKSAEYRCCPEEEEEPTP